MKIIDRRKFLGMSALAGAGALISPQIAHASANKTGSVKEDAKIATRTLGKTGITVPILSMGVMRADNPAVVRAAYNSGITLFDTAFGYQNGKNEEMLGEFFKDKDRNTFYIATKGNPGRRGNEGVDFEKGFEDMLNTSLKRLQMDYVDIYYMHAAGSAEDVKNPKFINSMEKFKAEGKIKFAGFSTHANNNFVEQIDAAIETGVVDVILISYNFKLNVLPELDAAIQRGVDAGIGFIAMKTMVGGGTDPQAGRGFGGGGGGGPVDGSACLRWVWQNKNITTAIPGFTSFDLLDNCLEAAHSPALTDSDRKYLADLGNQELMYCQNCEKCVKQCGKNLPIPDMMRAYMYNYGYKQPSLSKQTLLELAVGADACNGCSVCTVKCPSGFRVSEKIASIAPIVEVPDRFLA
jgi:predicted aldo/keto reductase-like oxidoreductase